MASTDNILLQVKNLRTYFFVKRGIVKAVDGISFSLRRGETIGLVGESGCGKSATSLSLLRLVPRPAGRIVEGKILLSGEDIMKKTDAEMRRIRGKQMSIILQDPMTSLNPAYNIGDQIGEAIKLHQGIKGVELLRRIVHFLRIVQIPAAETRVKVYPHQMSGGMRQRVLGAIALSCGPSIIIADEPTTSLDVTIQAQYLKLLKELQRQTGVALIFITHDLGIVASMCDRVYVMYAGKIVEEADTRELFNNPRHPYTQGLLGCLPKLGTKRYRLTTIKGQPPDLANLPLGCAFADRCAKKDHGCQSEYPSEFLVNDNHYVRCWQVQQ